MADGFFDESVDEFALARGESGGIEEAFGEGLVGARRPRGRGFDESIGGDDAELDREDAEEEIAVAAERCAGNFRCLNAAFDEAQGANAAWRVGWQGASAFGAM